MLPAVTDVDEAVQGFAALMAGARSEAAPAADPEAPFGYMKDAKTGEMRPKKSPGRPKTPSLEDLKAAKEDDPANGEPGNASPPGDRPPTPPKGRKERRLSAVRDEKPLPPVPQKYRAEGSIAKGVNQMYRQLGKLLRAFDRDVGQAFIDITRAEDEEDLTVGDAWEAYARTNPRVRAFLIRLLSGSATAQLFRVHLPIVAAIVMKEAIRERIPLGRLFMAFAEDEDEAAGEQEGAAAHFMSGMTEQDIAGAMAFAQSMMGRVQAAGTGREPGGD